MKRGLKQDIWYLAFLFITNLIILIPLYSGKMPFDFDNLAFYHPMFSLLHHRPFVLWDPYQFGGFPVYAEPQYALFYPLRWLFFFFDVYHGMSIFYILHNLLGILFMYYFLRSLEISRVGSTGGTMGFILGSYFLAKLAMSGTLFYSMVWIPLFLLFAIRALDRISLRYTILAGWVLGLLALIGSPHHFFYPYLAVGIYLVFVLGERWWKRGEREGKDLLKAILYCVVILLIGVGIGAIQFLPTQQLLSLSARSHLTYAQITEPSLPSASILGTFLGGTGKRELMDFSAYFGVAGLLFIVFAFLERGKKEIKLWYFLSLAVVAILIARGNQGIFYPVFYHLPFLKSLSFPCRSLILMAVAGPVLTAYGIDSVIRWNHKEKPKYFYGILVSVLVICVLVLVYLSHAITVPLIQVIWYTKWTEAVLFRWSNLSLFLILSSVTLYLFWKRYISETMFGILVLAIFFIDLYHFSPRLPDQYVNAKDFLAPSPGITWLQRHIQNPTRVLGYEGSRLYAIDQNDNRFMEYLTPRLGELYRLEDAQGYDPMMLVKYVTLMKRMAGRSVAEDPQRMATVAGCDPRFLNLMNVEYVVGEVNEIPVWRGQVVITEGSSTTISVDTSIPCVELGLITLLDRHEWTPQGTQVGTVIVTGRDGKQEKIPIRAGIETADWRSGNIPTRHMMPKSAMHWQGYFNKKEYTFNNFYVRLPVSHPIIPKTITLEHAHMPGVLAVELITLIKQNDQKQFEKIREDNGVRVYRNKTVYPRAFFVKQVETISDDSILLDKLGDKTTDLRNVAFISETPPTSSLGKEGNQGDVKITQWSPQEIKLDTQTNQTGFLVLSEIDYPGWKAYIDGKATKMYTADYVLRGIFVEGGRHAVTFKFQPVLLKIGIVITLLILLITQIGLILSFKTG